MEKSIFHSALRSFIVSLFSMTGICLGIIPALLIFALVFGSNTTEPEKKFDVEPIANAEGERKALSKDTPTILNIDIVGVIGAEGLTKKEISQMLVESREGTIKNNVKGIFLNIDSPGGGITDVDGIYKAIKAYKEAHKIPVYAYVDGQCFSGGMYIACAADKVYTSGSSIVGSVGVITPSFMNFSQLIDKIGVQALTLYAGKGKDDMNPLRPWKTGEQDSIQSIITYFYHDFVNIVAANRPNMSKEKLIEEYGANIYPATKAQEYGYVDEIGYSRNQTLKALLHEIGIEDDKYQVVQLKSTNWLSSLVSAQSFVGKLFGSKVSHEIKVPGMLDPALEGKFLYLHKWD